ncbi:MAG: hypothetical protein KF833_19970 [Verrucomicrobiae bacterium]|nr:hypothetical protein [Verrucomicrobiae bacterium]
MDRLAWNLETLVGDYDRAGSRDARWDAVAREFLTGFGHIRCRTPHPAASRMGELAHALMEAGCTDPMVLYLLVRFRPDERDRTPAQRAEDLRLAADRLLASGYSAVRKFYAALRASESWKAAHGRETGAVYNRYREQAHTFLIEMLKLPELPAEEGVEGIRDFAAAVAASVAIEDGTLPTLIDCLGRRWPDHARALLVRGNLQLSLAWNRRGSGYADTVSDAGWEGFAAHIENAGRDLEKSWRLDPTVPDAAASMLRVMLGRETDIARARLWFNRAMEADPACYQAARHMAWYLQPKWHGSVEQALSFGRRCVENQAWKGDVPLVLVDVHDMLAADGATGLKERHWTQPGVWKDVKASYDRFFELNPGATQIRNNFARYAHKCGQFGVFLDILPTIKPLNPAVFGGRPALEQMVAEAAAATGRTPQWPGS